MTILNCNYCNKQFLTYHKGKFCSRGCYSASRWATEHCKQCGVKTGMRRFCNLKCQRDYWNKNDYKLIKKKRHWERKFEILKKLGNRCIVCGESDYRVLDINHKDRTKKEKPKHKNKFSMSFSYNTTFRLKEWTKNIDNLELLCANCHRRHTWKQMGYYESDEEYCKIAEARINNLTLK